MKELLTHANHLDNLNCADGKSPSFGSRKYQAELRDLRELYEAILAQAQTENPTAPQLANAADPDKASASV